MVTFDLPIFIAQKIGVLRSIKGQHNFCNKNGGRSKVNTMLTLVYHADLLSTSIVWVFCLLFCFCCVPLFFCCFLWVVVFCCCFVAVVVVVVVWLLLPHHQKGQQQQTKPKNVFFQCFWPLFGERGFRDKAANKILPIWFPSSFLPFFLPSFLSSFLASFLPIFPIFPLFLPFFLSVRSSFLVFSFVLYFSLSSFFCF